MRSLNERPSASDMRVTLHKFGKKRRRVLRWEWLTLLPVITPVPVKSQRRAMEVLSFVPNGLTPCKLSERLRWLEQRVRAVKDPKGFFASVRRPLTPVTHLGHRRTWFMGVMP